ncbi:hypothetical protein C2S51_014957 [Perilla frutescens var. frutescens]|nr:hypothetical protein C2S51_014957 [Perilla frutescens var. frutescens]
MRESMRRPAQSLSLSSSPAWNAMPFLNGSSSTIVIYFAEIAKFLGITTTIDTESIQQVSKDIKLIDAMAEKLDQIISEECKLFPADVQIHIYPLPDISDLEKQLSDQSNRLLNLQEMVDDPASKIRQKYRSLIGLYSFKIGSLQYETRLTVYRKLEKPSGTHAAVAVESSETVADEPSSLIRIIVEC